MCFQGKIVNVVKTGSLQHLYELLWFDSGFQIEEQINIETLEQLKQAFAEADANQSGQLDLEEFKALLKQRLYIKGNKVEFSLGGVQNSGLMSYSCFT